MLPRSRAINVGSTYTGIDAVAIAIEEMEQIVKLRIENFELSLNRNILSKISRLHHLEVLELRTPIRWLTRIPAISEFPQNLLKLVLFCEYMVEDPMPVLEKLPKLVMLQLCCIYNFKDMHCSANGFLQLKYLKLHYSSVLEDWKVDVGAMPSLCHLKLIDCNVLKMFPEELLEHQQLQLVEIIKMSHLHEVDYGRLKEKGCKVILAEEEYDNKVSDF